MKRTLRFRTTEGGYALFDDENKVFEIAADNLQFDIKEFYYAFYANEKSSDEIELINAVESNSNARRIFDCINSLMNSVKTKLEEISRQEQEEKEGED